MTTMSKPLPPGTYWIGDPCYAIDDTATPGLWIELLESAGEDWGSKRILETTGFTASGTASGDGTYEDQQGRTYPVDAGLIGATPATPGAETPWGMTEVTIDTDFTVAYDEDGGTITIGPVTIETDPTYECDGLWCNNEIEEWQDYCDACEAEQEEDEEEDI